MYVAVFDCDIDKQVYSICSVIVGCHLDSTIFSYELIRIMKVAYN